MSHVADSPKKSPFRPHFRAFYPHPAHGSSLRVSRGSCGMPSLRRCPLANWPKISVGNWAPPPKERRGHPLSGARETWLATFESLSTVLPPLATTTRCRPPKMGLFACPIPPWFVLSNNLLTTNTRAIWLCFGAFLSPPASSLQFHWLLTTILPSHAPRRNQRGQVVRRPSSTGYCLTPTGDLSKTERSPISTNGHSIFSISPNQAIPAEKSIRCSLLAAAGPLTILSWPEALNASRSKRARRMAIRCNACSLLDFPEFAQAVRNGVPGTPSGPEIRAGVEYAVAGTLAFSWVQGAAPRHK